MSKTCTFSGHPFNGIKEFLYVKYKQKLTILSRARALQNFKSFERKTWFLH